MSGVGANSGNPIARIIGALGDAGLLVSHADNLPSTIADLVDDSRHVHEGACFVAVRGAAQDGHQWLPSAATRGASMAIVEDATSTDLPCIVVRDSRRAAAAAAAAYYEWPARKLTIIGVTGTNGKTTTVGLLRHLFDRDTQRAASIGTLGVLLGSQGTPLPGGGGLTTPGPVELQRVLAEFVRAGVQIVAMEVSSHSLEQRRVEGVSFAAAVFTNLTRDHLDYHGTMESYRTAKSRLAALLTRDGVAVVNGDDAAWQGLSAPRTVTFGIETPADVMARDRVFGPDGSRFLLVAPTGATSVALPLIGDFNVANALGAAATALALGMSLSDVATGLETVPQVDGRLERLHDYPTVLRDYAHTPDALERAIRAVRPFAPDGRVIVLFGCGGDRDRGKRPVMGRIAESLADVVIVTSDNPRTEAPDAIIDDIEAGMTKRDHLRIVDRREAIVHALSIAAPEDVVLLAGKGHETYQIRGTTSYPFDEREIVRELSMLQSGET